MHGNGLVAAGMPLVFGVTEFSIVGERLFVRNLVWAPEHICTCGQAFVAGDTYSIVHQRAGSGMEVVLCGVPCAPYPRYGCRIRIGTNHALRQCLM